MTETLTGSAVPADSYDVALYDLDGVVYLGDEPVTHAPAAIQAAAARGLRPLYVTNNSSREPEDIAAQITGFGIPCEPQEIVTSAQSVALLLQDELEPGARVLPVGGQGLRTALSAAGFELVTSAADAPAAVVQGFAPDLGWRDLAEAAYAVGAGARHVATNLDGSIPKERGVAPGNGALVRAVVEATGIEPLASGKPLPAIYHQAADRLGASSPIAVGDRLDTDLEGARAAGMPGLLVLTGVTTARDAVLAPAHQRPSLLALDLRGLFVQHPAPLEVEDGRWGCGAAVARVHDGALELVDDPTGPLGPSDPQRLSGGRARVSLDGWRALCVAAWDAADRGAPLAPEVVPALVVG
ncbi:Haloacid Dehalogenase Superfamily Class (subfamily) IIA [Georgenia satyanarayanai]|uniref:Haloacid Dehalogenase Superfamily Class (Subfamily) IIA n=1 Tax=Georgenia satyanarayanai TaxID=860221 RepID=A0A2Y9BYV6_9MICO|nr:HAD-IIA family hydrolase [Georgenia satyanarayanai]PYF99124.1 HAD superfamily hydrolase (TIGR01450 family) [Georgenia satyanarayanai]SSA43242.1 Haloacid Dehalogenase Superfamily Class (subfamily) IIA [Georgenia satyanarayanai]